MTGPTPRSTAPRATSAAALAVLLLLGCGRGSEKTVEITDVRELKDAGPVAPDAPAARRFRFARDAQRRGPADDPHGASPSRWAWTTPPGWTETGPARFREMGWTIASSADLEASFATAGGGLLANVNRWRGQMGLPSTDEAGLAALERRPLLGREGTLVELAGTYAKGGMGAPAKSIEGARMLALIVELPATAVVAKLVGPAAAVDAERERFLALAASIRSTMGATGPGPPVPTPAPAPTDVPDVTAGKAPFAWTAPEGWTRKPDRAMRVATFAPANAKEAEVVVSILSGPAGGARANVDRWRSQMGLAPLGDAEYEALARKAVMGGTGVFLSIEGEWGGMGGGAGKKGWMLLGMVLEGEERSVFVKLTGPADEVRGESDRLRAFCESFHE